MKRSRDSGTEAIVDELLEEFKSEKEAKKSGRTREVKPKGKTFQEIEEEEGGPVKESLITAAQTKRAASRKQRKDAAADTDLVDDVEVAEEDLQAEDEDAQQFEPFNLKQEREEGSFDDGGFYVEKKGDEDVEDAWLNSEEAKVVSDKVRKQIEEREKKAAAEDEARALSARQIGQLQGEIAGLMQPGETVTRALKRLGGGSKRPPASRRSKKQGEDDSSMGDKEGVNAARRLIERLTEAASLLLQNGELDIYSATKEALEKEASLFGPSVAATAAPGGDDMFGEEGDDMYGDEKPSVNPTEPSTKPLEGAPKPSTSAPAEAAAQPGSGGNPREGSAPNPKGVSAPEEEVDYASWPIKELRRVLEERGEDASGIIDKSDLVARVREAVAKGPEGEGEVAPVPQGYAFDPSSGYYYSSDANMYYDAASAGFYSSVTGRWYSYDAGTGGFAEYAS